MQCAQKFEYFAVNFTVTSVRVRQLCLKRIGVRSQKSVQTVIQYCCCATHIIKSPQVTTLLFYGQILAIYKYTKYALNYTLHTN